MTKNQIRRSTSFNKDLKDYQHKPNIMAMLQNAIQKLTYGEKLPKEHALKGKLKGNKECHLRYGLLLVWSVNGSIIELLRLGTHHQIFGR